MTEMQWVVLLNTGNNETVAYGPIDDAECAEAFAVYLTAEVDPASVRALRSPVHELLAWWRNNRQAADQPKPGMWPPMPGSIWQDKNGDRWAAIRVRRPDTSYLVCLASQAEDNADEIWRRWGPLTFVQFIAPTLAEEPPF
jgi:hypothetical protein